jgi:hypothetical protein
MCAAHPLSPGLARRVTAAETEDREGFRDTVFGTVEYGAEVGGSATASHDFRTTLMLARRT